ncbi:hypothetical protein FSW04_11660 [Baekduia soli]|uniref:Uncharacterized protein n=1 Tax=Baekduia soli TaxID=496014 RepID=A0A5B8U4V4_9ACTN|nr:hypothetical protein [Baekduia soli]QEC48159.1 hypothetical protein FSW04_11660 [Baekduia soli]
MTTYAPHDTTRDERVREAWATYRDDLADLDGRAYDEAEAASWDRLQDRLRDIDGEHRAAVAQSGGPAG